MRPSSRLSAARPTPWSRRRVAARLRNADADSLPERPAYRTLMERVRDHLRHLHPTLAAILPPCPFITAREWRLPNRASPPLTSQETCMNRLTEIEAGLADPAEPLIAWGYHRSWHGAVTREMLSAAPADRPIALWQRSFHEGVADAAAIGWMGLDRADLERQPPHRLPEALIVLRELRHERPQVLGVSDVQPPES